MALTSPTRGFCSGEVADAGLGSFVPGCSQGGKGAGSCWQLDARVSKDCGHPRRTFTPGVPVCGERGEMLWAILAVLVILWLLGFSFHIGRWPDSYSVGR